MDTSGIDALPDYQCDFMSILYLYSLPRIGAGLVRARLILYT